MGRVILNLTGLLCRLNEIMYVKYLAYAAAAAAAKSLQSCLTLCNPIDGSPPGSPVPGILQARTLEWVAISFSSAWKGKVKVKSLSHVRLFATPWTVAHQAPPSMGFSRQEYWSGVPLPSPWPILGGLKHGTVITLQLQKFTEPCGLSVVCPSLYPSVQTTQRLCSWSSQASVCVLWSHSHSVAIVKVQQLTHVKVTGSQFYLIAGKQHQRPFPQIAH